MYIISCSNALITELHDNIDSAQRRVDELNALYPVSNQSCEADAYYMTLTEFVANGNELPVNH